MGFRSVPDRYTPFFDALSDKEAREQHRVDEEEYFRPSKSSFLGQGQFEAVVMSPMVTEQNKSPDSNANAKHTSTYLMVKGITDSTLPKPCDLESFGTDPEEKAALYNYVLSCYPRAQSLPLIEGQVNINLQPEDVVSCQVAEGPAFMGRMRGLTYDGTRVSRVPGFNKPGCAGFESLASAMSSLPPNYIAGADGNAPSGGESNKPIAATDSQFAKQGLVAKSYSRNSKRSKPGYIKYIMLHSTDGSNGPADKTLRRFAEGPTIAYEWTNPNTGQKISNPTWDQIKNYTNNQLPHKTVLRERKYRGKPKALYVEKIVSTSIHYAVDGLAEGNIWQGLAEVDVGHHAPKFNHTSIGIEMCGKPNLDRGKGATPNYSGMYNDIMLNNCAQLCADICVRNNLPPNRETIRGHEDGQKSNRTDPGESKQNFDYTDFLARVRNYYKQMGGTAQTS